MKVIYPLSTDLLYSVYYSNLEIQSIYGFLEFDSFIDEKRLVYALNLIQEKLLPMLFFRLNSLESKWEDIGIKAEDCVCVITPKQAKNWRPKNFFKTSQCYINIVRGPRHDFMRVQLAHIIADGMGFHLFMKYLSGFYNGTFDKETPMKNVRSYWELHKTLDTRGVKKSKKGVLKRGRVDLKGFERNINPSYYLKREVIKPEQWVKICKQIKQDGCSINDMVVTAWMRTLHLMSGHKIIKMNCPSDIRVYSKNLPEITMGNFTGTFSVETEYTGKESFKQMMQTARDYLNLQKKDKIALFTVRSMGIAALIPKSLARYIYGKAFVYTDTAYTNVGRIDEKNVTYNGLKTVNAFYTGAYYSIPTVNLSFTTYNNQANLVINSVTTKQNFEIIKQLGKNVRRQIDIYMQEAESGKVLPLDTIPTLEY